KRAGRVVAVWVNYACHCTTVGSANRIGGDWAGKTNELLEQAFPESTALTTIGCGADVGPQPSGNMAAATQHAESIVLEVRRVIAAGLQPLTATAVVHHQSIALPLTTPLPDEKTWMQRAERNDYEGFNARWQLQRLKKEGQLPTAVDYPITTWQFGEQLAMVFLAGEVCVDYAVRLKTELDHRRVWINGWCNDVPCYIPSARLLREGGYETDFSMIYYAQPSRFDPSLEDLIVNAVKSPLADRFMTAAAPDLSLFRGPSRQELFQKRMSTFAGSGTEIGKSMAAIAMREKISLAGFARINENQGAEDAWYDFTGGMRKRPYIRQQAIGTTLAWETSPFPPEKERPPTFVFAGAVGYESEPRTDGFELRVGDADPVRFDVTRTIKEWSNDDRSVQLAYYPTWSSEVDSAGFFYLTVAMPSVPAGQPLTVRVRSLGKGSQRWFAIDPVPELKAFERAIAQAIENAKP
ncbi:MAG: hypothetical protein RIS70_1527, partial [Planctomycetota bacterium]